jgi:hypothetical protein
MRFQEPNVWSVEQASELNDPIVARCGFLLVSHYGLGVTQRGATSPMNIPLKHQELAI